MHLIVDLEATCCEIPRVPDINEIIDIGVVVCDDEFNILKTWTSLVKPKINTKLSPFCKRLTSIRQHDVDSAPYLSDAINSFNLWFQENFKITAEKTNWFTWGNWDLKCLITDCERNKISFPFSSHKNLKDIYFVKRQCIGTDKLGIKEVMIREGISLPQKLKLHRGISDATAAALIARFTFLLPEINEK